MDYYTYILQNSLDGEMIYVGKGKKRRMYIHYHRAVTNFMGGNQDLYHKIREIYSQQGHVIYHKTYHQDEDAALFEEIQQIKKYGRRDCSTGTLFNKTDGGDGSVGSKWTDESRELRRQQELSKNAGNDVTQFTMGGEVLREFSSATRASKELFGNETQQISIVDCCKGKRISAGGYRWAFKGEQPHDKNPSNRPKIVIQQDLNGRTINQYASASEAAKLTNIHMISISRCCRGKSKTAGGFIWLYQDDGESAKSEIGCEPVVSESAIISPSLATDSI